MTRNTRAQRLAFLLAATVGHLSAAEDAVRIPWLQDNLMPNPGFEELTRDGRTLKAWTARRTSMKGKARKQEDMPPETDGEVVLQGRRSLRIAIREPNTRVDVTSPLVPVEGGATYLFSVAYRGVSHYAFLYWLDENRKGIVRRYLYCSAAPTWDLRDTLMQAPPNARFARIQFGIGNPQGKPNAKRTLWVDALQFRRYLPPPTPEWAKGRTRIVVDGAKEDTRVLSYFVGIDGAFRNSRGGGWSQVVTDPEAERGTALQARTAPKAGYMAISRHFKVLPPGLYRMRVRVKIPAGTEGVRVGTVNVGSQLASRRQSLFLVHRKEHQGRYTVLQADFTIWDSGYWALTVGTDGKAVFTVDSIKISRLRELDDRQLLALYPGIQGEVPPRLKPPAPPSTGQELKGLVVAGMGYERFRIADVFGVLALKTRMKVVWVKGAKLAGFPQDPRDLFEYSIIYLCNVNLRRMTLKDKNAIREYVKRGGALVVMGGQQGYERGGWRGSLVEQALPVTVAPAVRGGLVHVPAGQALTVSREVPWLEAISTASSPRAYYLHAVTVKPTGHVLVRAGDRPFMVTGAYGKGRVVCILGLPYGDPGPQQAPFWQWGDWVHLFREVCWWAMRSPRSGA